MATFDHSSVHSCCDDTLSDLPQSLVLKLKDSGVDIWCQTGKCKPVNVSGGEKVVYRGKLEGEQVVVLYSRQETRPNGQKRWIWNYKQEIESLQQLKNADEGSKGSEFIARMVSFFLPANDHGPCMVAEGVTPIGFDLCQLCTMYAVKRQGKMPLLEVDEYFQAVTNGVKYIHSKRWVHCDLKAENVVVGDPPRGSDRPTVKVIDFGMARLVGEKFDTERVLYMAPECVDKDARVDTEIDCWGLGHVLWQLWAGVAFPDCTQPVYREHWLRGILDGWGLNINPECTEALEGLLQLKREDRWTLEQLQSRRPSLMSNGSPGSPVGDEYTLVKDALKVTTDRANNSEEMSSISVTYTRGRIPLETMAMKVSRGSQLVGKYLGPGRGRPMGHPSVLDLRKTQGALVMFLEREGGQIEKCPGANTQLSAGDWIFLARDPSQLLLHEGNSMVNISIDALKQRIMAENAKDDDAPEFFTFYPEFDEFEFPENCHGAHIFPIQAGPVKLGQRGMDLRAKFDINLIAVRRITEGRAEIIGHSKFFGYEVRPGDIGVVSRIPDKDTGLSRRIVTDDMIFKLSQAEHLVKTEEALAAAKAAQPAPPPPPPPGCASGCVIQ